jgi:hypothetical protein
MGTPTARAVDSSALRSSKGGASSTDACRAIVFEAFAESAVVRAESRPPLEDADPLLPMHAVNFVEWRRGLVEEAAVRHSAIGFVKRGVHVVARVVVSGSARLRVFLCHEEMSRGKREDPVEEGLGPEQVSVEQPFENGPLVRDRAQVRG